jgi:hypothetical protein
VTLGPDVPTPSVCLLMNVLHCAEKRAAMSAPLLEQAREVLRVPAERRFR